MADIKELEQHLIKMGFKNSSVAPHLFYDETLRLRYRFNNLGLRLERKAANVANRPKHSWLLLRSAYYRNLKIKDDALIGMQTGGMRNNDRKAV